MKYHFEIHKEDVGFWAQCLEIPGCMTQGNSKEDLSENMQEAINVCLEEPDDITYLAPLPDESYATTEFIVEVPVDPTVAFGFMVRYHRIKKGITQKEAARRLGMKNLFSYQRLERRCNATIEIVGKLLDLFPQISLNKIFR